MRQSIAVLIMCALASSLSNARHRALCLLRRSGLLRVSNTAGVQVTPGAAPATTTPAAIQAAQTKLSPGATSGAVPVSPGKPHAFSFEPLDWRLLSPQQLCRVPHMLCCRLCLSENSECLVML